MTQHQPILMPKSLRMAPGVERAKAFQVDPANPSNLFCLEEFPNIINREDFRAFIISAVMSGVDDLTLQSDQRPRGTLDKRLRFLGPRRLSESEIHTIIEETFGSASAISELQARNILDYSYALSLPSGLSQRFRVNVTPIRGGFELSFRAFPTKTPDFKMNRLTEEEARAMLPLKGIVLISGSTGSGKSTTAASLIGNILTNTRFPRKIVDFQQPTEYDFSDIRMEVEGSAGLIGMSEVGRDIKSFADGIRSALRRNPEVINVGESRDAETIKAVLEAGISGHLTLSTTHANSVEETIHKMLGPFSGTDMQTEATRFAGSIRFMSSQMLAPHKSGKGVVPIREYLQVSDKLRSTLLRTPVDSWTSILIDRMNKAPGTEDDAISQTYTEACKRHFNRGEISEETVLMILGPKGLERIGV